MSEQQKKTDAEIKQSIYELMIRCGHPVEIARKVLDENLSKAKIAMLNGITGFWQ